MNDEEDTAVMQAPTDAEDRDAIRQLMLRYCRAVDRLDAELLASAFFDDARIVVGHAGIDVRGSDWPAAAIERNGERSLASMHAILNHYVELDGDAARGETYFHRHQVQRSGDGRVLSTHYGRYLDRYERRDGEWRIAFRTVVSEWTTVQEVVVSEAADGVVVGARGHADPSYALLDGSLAG